MRNKALSFGRNKNPVPLRRVLVYFVGDLVPKRELRPSLSKAVSAVSVDVFGAPTDAWVRGSPGQRRQTVETKMMSSAK
jgi:hypothetical protein